MKHWLPDWRMILVVVIVAVMTLMVMDFNSRMAEWRRLSVRRDQVAVEATGLKRTQVSLQTQIAYATSPAGVQAWAYGQGKRAEKGVVIVVPVPAGESTPVPTPQPTVTPQVVHNWQLWWSLFFDQESP